MKDPDVRRIPVQIGTYRIIEQIGEGGMGTVYLAEQRGAIRRVAAVKVLKPGLDSKEVLARFEAERQALAIMDHPSIARVFEAGLTENGMPYFAMEHVPGVPITEFCNRQKLALADRLALFLQVAEGIQHAHHKGVIHRDLKPTNVLACQREGGSFAKIIDFGIAKATNQRLTERTMFTELGQILGTPDYMSPEQAEMTPAGVDARSDIYSLGVILYELLVGALPFDPKELRAAGFAEMQRLIREQEPRRPSTRFTTLQGNAAVASQRNADPRSWIRALRGDLDWVILHAMEKNPARRYQSASEFAQDVRRYLAGRPVEARPPSVLYRWSTFVRRNRLPVALAGSLLLSLIVGLGFSIRQFVRAEGEAADAIKHATEARNESERSARIAGELQASQAQLSQEFRRSEASRLLLQGRDLMREDQGLAFALAVAGARAWPSFEANRTLATLLCELRLRRSITLPDERAHAFSPTASGLVAMGRDVAVHVDLERQTVSGSISFLSAETVAGRASDLAKSRSTPATAMSPDTLERLLTLGFYDLADLQSEPISWVPALRSLDRDVVLKAEAKRLTVLRKVDGLKVAELAIASSLRGIDFAGDQIWMLDEEFRVHRWQWRSAGSDDVIIRVESPRRRERDAAAPDREEPVTLGHDFRVFPDRDLIIWSEAGSVWRAPLSTGTGTRLCGGFGFALHVGDAGVLIASHAVGCQLIGDDGKRVWTAPLLGPRLARLGADSVIIGFTKERKLVIVYQADGRELYASAEPVASYQWYGPAATLWTMTAQGSLRCTHVVEHSSSHSSVGDSAIALLDATDAEVVLLRKGGRLDLLTAATRAADLQLRTSLRSDPVDGVSSLVQGMVPGTPRGLNIAASKGMVPQVMGTVMARTIGGSTRVTGDAIWTAATGSRLRAMHGGQRSGLWQSFSPDGEYFWSMGTPDQQVPSGVFATATGQQLLPGSFVVMFARNARMLQDQFAWTPTPGTFAMASETKGVVLRSIREPDRRLVERASGVIGIAVLADRGFVLRMPNGELQVVDAQGTRLQTLKMTDDELIGHVCTAGRTAVIAIGLRSIAAIDTTSGQQIWQQPCARALSWTASDDARLFACGTHDGDVVVVDIADGKVVSAWKHKGASVLALAFDVRAERLAVGSRQGVVTVHTVAEGMATHELPQPAPDLPCAVGFAADGQTLVVQSLGGTFTCWPLDILSHCESVMPRQLTAAERQQYRVPDR